MTEHLPGVDLGRRPDAGLVVDAARRLPRRRRRTVVAGLAVLLVLTFSARVLLGDFTITVPDFIRILSGEQIPGATFILMESKLPRALLALLVGGSFGLAGALFQSTLRNPLASPDVIGVSMGASASAVFAIVVLDAEGVPLAGAAIVGALAVAALTRWVAGTGTGQSLVLVGVGVATVLGSVIQYFFTRADEWDAHLVLRWLTGSVAQADWATLRLLGAALLVVLPAVAWVSRDMGAAELGPDTAAALGVAPRRTDLVLGLGVVLVAVGVAAAGPIAFVAFVSGPVSRALDGGRTSLVAAALVGACLTIGADYAADYLVGDVNLPVGVVTGAVGAPFLLWLLARDRTGRRAA
ncbi:Fe(3+) dicitrate transport system permease protein FecD [Nocardioides dokdonensis FR1436]|uniref:Fe(3+) dicitrate transport system permease protein FecD n=1 Tax=Nocardioides dokdonensis FR1436 TaxID=1300347 RepID=A0A1A9GNZ3_9ACTN|nr:iron chelate uptake ABC transporter family permease subunit [Nocardioides dokdonensis]ANH40029.1 Fe(3+) dicitrate transport system permease protein FecD [Nocardioides dokdonensis FR1436]